MIRLCLRQCGILPGKYLLGKKERFDSNDCVDKGMKLIYDFEGCFFLKVSYWSEFAFIILSWFLFYSKNYKLELENS